MVENLAVSSTKCKPFRLSRSDRRLVGWVKMRLSVSRKPWIHLCMGTFCNTTGIGLRTAKRSLQKLRDSPHSDIIARTINENAKWKILVSSSHRLDGLKRAEPFSMDRNGKKVRIVKEQIRGRQINEEQLILGEDPKLWKAKPRTHEGLDQEVGGLTPNNTLDSSASFLPGQMNLDLDVSDSKSGTPKSSTTYARTRMSSQVTISSDSTSSNNDNVRTKSWHNRPGFEQRNRECHFWDRHYKGKNFVLQRSKHGDAGSAHKMRNQKMRNFAFYIARNDLRQEHWDNCKIQHTMRHGFNYALQELEKGCNRRTIVKAYQMALRECHSIAVDAGVTEQASWLPSSTINKAKSILAEGDCRGKWWDRIAQESQDVVITA